jgi:hypothetical protein
VIHGYAKKNRRLQRNPRLDACLALASPDMRQLATCTNPTFEVLQDDAASAKETNRNPFWQLDLAEAIHCDDLSSLFTNIERCNTVKKFQSHTDTNSRESSNSVAPQVEKINAMRASINYQQEITLIP